MILDDAGAMPKQPTPAWGRATLDGILRKNAREHPDRIALVDDPERESWNGVPAEMLTWAKLDRRVDALAGFFRMTGLEPDTIIAIDAPPTADTAIILLAAFRAGLIVFPVPSLWTRRDCMAILSPLAPRAVVVTSVSKGESRAERLRDVADTIRTAKLVFGYGGGLPGGVIDLAGSPRTDDIPPPALGRGAEAGDHVATVTANGGAPGAPQLHARSHRHWLASGLTFVLEARLREGASFLLPFALSGLTGIGAGIVPWLLTAGTLYLHRFDRLTRLAAAAGETGADAIVLPGPLSAPLRAAGIWNDDDAPAIAAIWKDAHPESEKLAGPPGRRIIDITAIDDLAFVARRRERAYIAPLPVGPVNVPSDSSGGAALLEIRVDGHLHRAGDAGASLLGGYISLRGMAVPSARSIPVEGAERAGTGIEIGPDGFVRTAVEGRLADGPLRGVIPAGRHDTQGAETAPEDATRSERPGRRAAI